MSRPKLALLGSGSIAMLFWIVPSAQCAAGAGEAFGSSGPETEGTEDDDEVTKEVDAVEKIILNTVGPLMTKLGYGGLLGFCSGMALKKIGNLAAFVIGVGFVGLQVAQYQGMIQIDFLEVKEKAIEVLDANGDGKFDANDLVIYWRKLKDILTHSIPSAGGFSSGFAMGVYYG